MAVKNDPDREGRLARELRENLRRRKTEAPLDGPDDAPVQRDTGDAAPPNPLPLLPPD